MLTLEKPGTDVSAELDHSCTSQCPNPFPAKTSRLAQPETGPQIPEVTA